MKSSNDTRTGRDFLTLTEAEQLQLIGASVTNAAKMIESRSGKDAAAMLADHGEDARQEAFALALERIDTAAAGEPLALYAAKCAGAALSALVYAGSRDAVELDPEYHAGSHAPAPDAGILFRDRLAEIIGRLRVGQQARAAELIALVYRGYSPSAAAAVLGISPKTACALWADIQAAARS